MSTSTVYREIQVALASVVILLMHLYYPPSVLFRGAMEPPSEDEAMDGRDGDVLHADEVEVEGDGQEALFDFVDDGKSPESDGEGDAASDDGDEVAPPPPKKGEKELSPLKVPS